MDDDQIARIAQALARDFERDTGASILHDAAVMKRLTGALARLPPHGDVELNLPFLAANADGPVHYQKTFTQAQLAALAAG
jgi:hypothetical protein